MAKMLQRAAIKAAAAMLCLNSFTFASPLPEPRFSAPASRNASQSIVQTIEKADSSTRQPYPCIRLDRRLSLPDSLAASLGKIDGMQTTIFRSKFASPAYAAAFVEKMDLLNQSLYRDIYFEGLPSALQKDVDTYLEGGKMSKQLSSHVMSLANERGKQPSGSNPYLALFQKARALGWKVLACEAPSLQSVSADADLLVFREIHTIYKFRDYLAGELERLDRAGYKRIFLELLSPNIQEDINAYLKDGTISLRLSSGIQEITSDERLGNESGRSFYNTSYFRILSEARRLGWDVVAIRLRRYMDDDYLRITDSHYSKVIRTAFDSDGKKSLLLIGGLHNVQNTIQNADGASDGKKIRAIGIIPLTPEDKNSGENDLITLPAAFPNGIYQLNLSNPDLSPSYLLQIGRE